MRLFHYTNRQGFEGIQESGIIYATNGRYGYGVYLTDLDPDTNLPSHVAQHLYHGGGPKNLSSGKLDYHFAFEMDFAYEYQVQGREHVFLYPHHFLDVRKFRVVSKGDLDAWNLVTSTLAAVGMGTAAVGATVAAIGLYNAVLDGRQQRLWELSHRLQTILKIITDSEEMVDQDQYSVKPTKDQGVCVYCNTCQTPISETFYGGMFYASTIHPEKLRLEWKGHQVLHTVLKKFRQKRVRVPESQYEIKGTCICCNKCCEVIQSPMSDPNMKDEDCLFYELFWHQFFRHDLMTCMVGVVAVAGIAVWIAIRGKPR